MKEQVNNMPSNITNIDFDLIKGWISEHLKTPNDIVHSEGRNVIVGKGIENKVITIPKLIEENKESWKKAWLDVYEACLDALQEKVNRIYVAGRKEGYIVQVSPNEVRVGVSIIKISDNHNSVAYARALEKIISTYNKIKEEETRRIAASPINVSHSTIKIDNPDKAITNMYKIGPEIAKPKPVVVTPSELPEIDSSIENKNDENIVKSVRMEMPKPVEEKNTIKQDTTEKHQVIIQKIPGNVSLDKNECKAYQEQSLVIVTCMSVKHGDGVFRDNIDILRKNIPNISIGSFIGGKSTNVDQAVKEGGRIIKLLNECNVSKLVIYEVNNDYINNHLKKKENIVSTIEAINKICDILTDGSYYPILCMDFDTYENIKRIVPEYNEKYPIIKCVTPKQKDLVSNRDDILYMNPSSDSDAVMVSDANMQTNLENIPKRTLRESYSGQAA